MINKHFQCFSPFDLLQAISTFPIIKHISKKKNVISFLNAVDSNMTNKVKEKFIIPTEDMHCKNQFKFSKKLAEY